VLWGDTSCFDNAFAFASLEVHILSPFGQIGQRSERFYDKVFVSRSEGCASSMLLKPSVLTSKAARAVCAAWLRIVHWLRIEAEKLLCNNAILKY